MSDDDRHRVSAALHFVERVRDRAPARTPAAAEALHSDLYAARELLRAALATADPHHQELARA